MKKITTALILFFCICHTNSQNKNEDYLLLDEVIPTLVKKGELYIYEKQSDFVNQKKFFSKTFLYNYTYPTIGVDNKKVKKLIKKLDFENLSAQKMMVDNWDFSKSKYSIIKYDENPSNQFDKIRRFKISKPIYSEDFKMAFIYYEDICGFIDCGSANVIIFKKCNNTWKLYLTIPIYIS